MTGSEYNISEIQELFRAGADAPVRVVLAGVFETSAGGGVPSEEDFLYSMRELSALAEACGLEPAGTVTQRLPRAGNAFYVGPGKVEEIKALAEETEAEAVIFNDSLTPAQFRNLQKALALPVLDRTGLILEIFRSRAKTRESMLQVDYARLSYIRTRLVGMWDTLGRKGGASGAQSSRGEGETQLELDRRNIGTRLAELRRELKNVEGEREVRRKKRSRASLPLVSLVGYTNAGKSTIMNAMLRLFGGDKAAVGGSGSKQVFEADMLFATLDSSVRRISPETSGDFLLSDTVGFIHRLPTTLVEAFKSTLEEAAEADLLLLVADRSDPRCRSHLEVTEEILTELGAGGIPRIVVYNKADLCDPPVEWPKEGPVTRGAGRNAGEGKSVYISARDEASIRLLAELIGEQLFGSRQEAELLIPYDRGAALHELMEQAKVLSSEYTEKGTRIRVEAGEELLKRYGIYRTDL